jgi:hypothetical protein
MSNSQKCRVVGVATLVLFSGVVATFAERPTPIDPNVLKHLYGTGTDFGTFLKNADQRGALAQLANPWNSNWRKSGPSNGQVARAQSLTGNYRLLAVASESCSDSVNTIPYIARLVDRVDQLEMQIVPPAAGHVVLQTYPTTDGRMATPTVVILNENSEVVGSWVERPMLLKDWWARNSTVSEREKKQRKQHWYNWDEGNHTIGEIVELLEDADVNSGH